MTAVVTVCGDSGSVASTPASGAVTAIDVSGGSTGMSFSGGPVVSSGIITMGGTLAIASGGTGHVTATSAFDALAPTSAKGEIIVNDGSSNVVLTVGADGQVPIADASQATGIRWGASPSAGVTSVATGQGLTGGPIIATGTVDLKLNASGGLVKNLGAGADELGIGALSVSDGMLANPKVSATRTISTTAPLTGGGDFSADRTLAISAFAGSDAGAVPVSLGGTTNFLRADGSWAAPAGSGGNISGTGTAGTISLFTGATDIGNSPLVASGNAVALGTTAATWRLFTVGGTVTGGVTGYGILANSTFASDVTTEAAAVKTGPSTAAAAFTLVTGHGAYIGDWTLGAGSAITSQYGVYIADQTKGASNYGLRSTVTAGTNKFNIYASGTAGNYLNGNTGIGVVPGATIKLHVSGTVTGSTTIPATLLAPTFASDVTGAGYGIQVFPSTQAASFTLGTATGVIISDWNPGAGSSITSQYGLYISDQTKATGRNAGIRSSVSSGTNKYNLYADGTAQNHLAGSLGIKNTAPGVDLDINSGSGGGQGIARVQGGSAADKAPISYLWRYGQAVWGLAAGGAAVTDLNVVLNPAATLATDAQIASASKLTIQGSTGYVGVGMTPSRLLDVDGVIRGQVQDYGGQVYNIIAYGADPTGTNDSTTAIQNALNAASATYWSGVALAPPGTYRCDGTLDIPPGVTLTGPSTRGWGFAFGGAELKTTQGSGNAAGTPFIYVGVGGALKNLAITHPDQVTTGTPTAYPWAVACDGFVTVENIHLSNAYQGINAGYATSGSYNAGVVIRNVSGMPLLTGIYLSHAADVQRVDGIHFWPYVSGLGAWAEANGTAIQIQRSDWIEVRNVFVYGYDVGIELSYDSYASLPGSCNGHFYDINLDKVNVGVDAYCTQFNGVFFHGLNHAANSVATNQHAIWAHAGTVAASNTVFIAVDGLCSWGTTKEVVLWANVGDLKVANSRIMQWGLGGTQYAIDVSAGRASVQDNYFAENWVGNTAGAHSPNAVRITAGADRGLVTGNSLCGKTVSNLAVNALTANNLA